MSRYPINLDRDDGRTILRDDLIEGGSKMRFLPHLCAGAEELVFGGPFCGGAPVALSVIGRDLGKRVTLFYAKRKILHRRQRQAELNGAKLVAVPFGYMANVQAKARAYAERVGARFLPLGFDSPEARAPFAEFMAELRAEVGSPDEIWCATGSGMLARCIAEGFPRSHVRAVAVGLKSRWEKQPLPGNVSVFQYPRDFAWEFKGSPAPFPICPNYEAKAYELFRKIGKRSALFWNVLGS